MRSAPEDRLNTCLAAFYADRAGTLEVVSGRDAADIAVLAARIDRLAFILERYPRGARILLSLSDGTMFFCAFWACIRSGCIVVPIVAAISPAEVAAVERAINAIQPVARGLALFTDCAALSSGNVAAELDLYHVEPDAVMAVRRSHCTSSSAPFDDARDEGDADDRTVLLQFTSGTTGSPKGCELSAAALFANAQSAADRFDFRAGQTMVNWMPLHHDMGLMASVIVPVVCGLSSHISTPREFMLGPLAWLRSVAARGPCHLTLPSFALRLIVQRLAGGRSLEADLSGVRSVICGAEPISAQVVTTFYNALADTGLSIDRFAAAYGMAEATVLVSARLGYPQTLDPAALLGRSTDDSDLPALRAGTALVSLGRPALGVSLEIRDDTGDVLAEGRVGRVHVRSTALMKGYFRDLARSADVLSSGWFRTNDLAMLVGGELYFVSRADEMLIVNGLNLSATDIEAAIAAATGIDPRRICAAIDERGDRARLHLFIEKLIADRDAATIHRAAASCLDVAAVQPVIHPLGNRRIPRTSSGKPRRHALLADLPANTVGTG